LAGGFESGIQVDGTEQGFEGIGKYRRATKAAGFQLALTQTQEVRQFQALSDFIQGLLLDQVRPEPGQIALVYLVVAIKQQGSDHTIQDGVAQELKALIMQPAMAAMGQRLLQ